MNLLTNVWRSFLPGEPAFWGALAGLVVVVGLLLLRRRRRRRACAAARLECDFHEADCWLPPTKTENERRSSNRRDEPLVAVRVTHPEAAKKVLEGYIVNRSTEGVRLAIKLSFPTGANLEIRAINAPEGTPWTKVTVRNCEPMDDYFRLGCQFDEKLPWNILLLFG
jgi:LPXTG-motif cell wall-anchored protein